MTQKKKGYTMDSRPPLSGGKIRALPEEFQSGTEGPVAELLHRILGFTRYAANRRDTDLMYGEERDCYLYGRGTKARVNMLQQDALMYEPHCNIDVHGHIDMETKRYIKRHYGWDPDDLTTDMLEGKGVEKSRCVALDGTIFEWPPTRTKD